MRSAEKVLREAIAKNDKGAADTLLKTYSSEAMKATKKGIWHKEWASRKISRLTSQVSVIK